MNRRDFLKLTITTAVSLVGGIPVPGADRKAERVLRTITCTPEPDAGHFW
jgi:hypothetical protein